MLDFALLEMFCDRMRMGFRSRRMDCPLGRGFAEGCPAERTRRSGPPPPGCWVHSARCGEGCGLGVSDPGFMAAHGIGFRSIQIQRSGHGGPRSRQPGAGPVQRPFLVGHSVGISDRRFLTSHWDELLWMVAQGSGHGGPPPCRGCLATTPAKRNNAFSGGRTSRGQRAPDRTPRPHRDTHPIRPSPRTFR